MLVRKSRGFNRLAREGVVVSFISCTSFFVSFRVFAVLVSLVPVLSDQPFHREMKASFPHLKKKEIRQKKLLHHQVLKVLSLACIPEMKRELNIVFSKGLFCPCWIWIYQPNIEIEAHGCLLQGSSQLQAYIGAWSCCFWNQCWCFDFHSTLRPTRNKYLAKARAPASRRSSPHVWEMLILWWSDELGAQPVPQRPGDAGMGQPSRVGSGCCWSGRSSACCTRQWRACSGNVKYNWKSKWVLKLQNTSPFSVRLVTH